MIARRLRVGPSEIGFTLPRCALSCRSTSLTRLPGAARPTGSHALPQPSKAGEPFQASIRHRRRSVTHPPARKPEQASGLHDPDALLALKLRTSGCGALSSSGGLAAALVRLGRTRGGMWHACINFALHAYLACATFYAMKVIDLVLIGPA